MSELAQNISLPQTTISKEERNNTETFRERESNTITKKEKPQNQKRGTPYHPGFASGPPKWILLPNALHFHYLLPPPCLLLKASMFQNIPLRFLSPLPSSTTVAVLFSLSSTNCRTPTSFYASSNLSRKKESDHLR